MLHPRRGPNKRGIVSRNEIKFLSGMTALSVAILAAAGRFVPQLLPDTPGYLRIVGFPAMLAEPRTPLYGWLVAKLAGTELGYAPVIWTQVLLHTIAAVSLFASVRSLGAANAVTTCQFLFP